MSTKIYDAYELRHASGNKDYGIKSLISETNVLRKIAIRKCREIIAERAINRIILYMDIIDQLGKEKLENMIPKKPERNQPIGFLPNRYDIYTRQKIEFMEKMLKNYDPYKEKEEQIKQFLLKACGIECAKDRVYENEDKTEGRLYVYPTRDKMLALYFGNQKIQTALIMETDILSDYHYQDQTDRPDGIPENEWKQRGLDWNDAIGDDYIPSNHGMLFPLVPEHATYGMDMDIVMNIQELHKNIMMPSIDRRAEAIFEYDTEREKAYTSKRPDKKASLSEQIKFVMSKDYKQFKAEQIDEIKNQLSEIHLELF